MNLLDWIIAALLLLGTVQGYRRGFFREAAALIGLLGGILLGIIAADTSGRILSGLTDWNPLPVQILAFILVFVVVAGLLHLIGISLTRMFKLVMLNLINRLAGMAFGFIKMAFLLSLLLFFLRLGQEHLGLLSEELFTESRLYSHLENLAPDRKSTRLNSSHHGTLKR